MGQACIYQTLPLSRLSTHNSIKGNDQGVKGLQVSISDINPISSNVTLDQFSKSTENDEDLKLLKLYVMHGWPSKSNECVEQLRGYYTFKEDIAFLDGLLFKGQRLVPRSLRNKTLEVLHRSHMGITKTLERSRTALLLGMHYTSYYRYLSKW